MKKIFLILVYFFAVFGFIMALGFFAVKFEWTKVGGQADQNTNVYNDFARKEGLLLKASQNTGPIVTSTDNLLNDLEAQIQTLEQIKNTEKENLCKIFVVSQYSDLNAKNLFNVYQKYSDQIILDRMVFAFSLKKNMPDFLEQIKACASTGLDEDMLAMKLQNPQDQNVFVWQNSEHWQIIQQALAKDVEQINEAARLSAIEAREIVSVTIVEQLRLYYTQRELFETFFKPLKILASANKMAWGIMAIKEKTAIQIENNLKDKNSPYYLGEQYEKLLDFKTNNHTQERYTRLTDEKNHFYSYLYGALYLKQIEQQWQTQGFDISQRPEILATLFNIGFKNSVPKANPAVGGSTMNILGYQYSFGSLAHEFYYSGVMEEEFSF